MTDADGAGATAQIDLVVIQPTPFCNIDCAYCYLPDRGNRATMRDETLGEIFRQIFALDLTQAILDVAWHAGEPLVLPPQWYEKAFSIIAERAPPSVEVRHEFQTNGMLISEEWCRLLKRANASIGVSIDGPKELHDANRRTRSGAGSFDKAMEGIGRLRSHGIEFSVITVLTSRSFDQAEALFEFYDSIGVSRIALICEEIDGVHAASSLAAGGAVERFKHFLRTFRALMWKSQKDWRIRGFESLYPHILGGPGIALINPQVVAGRFLCFDHQGHLSTYSPELVGMTHPAYGSFRLGNIMQQPLPAMLRNDKAAALAKEVAAGVALCRSSCDYFDVCGGGSPSNKLFENGSFATAQTLYCGFKIKATADVILEEISDAMGRPAPALAPH